MDNIPVHITRMQAIMKACTQFCDFDFEIYIPHLEVVSVTCVLYTSGMVAVLVGILCVALKNEIPKIFTNVE